MILAASRQDVPKYGIELIDVRIKRINYVQAVRKKVFERPQHGGITAFVDQCLYQSTPVRVDSLWHDIRKVTTGQKP